MMRFCCRMMCCLGLLAPAVAANDWPYWRGPEQTGMTREKAVVTSWTEDGENMLWRVPVGGRTTPVVMNGRICAITPVGEGECLQERVICLDADTGKTVWEHRFNAFHTDIVENRLGWTSLVGDPETGNIYAHSTGGEFFCFDRDGKVLWKWSLGEEFGRYSGYGGRLHTPIIDEDRVIISIVYILAQWNTGPQKSGHRYYAFDKRTGEVLWWSQPGGRPADTNYAVPIVTVADGRRLLVAPNADGHIYGLLARTGEKVWSFHLGNGGLHVSPVADGKYVYISHSEENIDTTEMGRVVCIDASGTGDITKTGEVWRAEGIKAGYASPALANGRVYVATNIGRLHAFDARTGKEHWEYVLGTVMRGSPVVTADGVIYVGEVNGRFHILKDAGDKAESLDLKEFERPDGLIVEIFGSPAVVDGRVYFMTRYHTYCLGSPEKTVERFPIPPLAAERKIEEGDAASASFKPVLKVIPAEAALAPGESVTFRVQQFDQYGRQRPMASAGHGETAEAPRLTWASAGVRGAIDSKGVFKASGDAVFSAGTVKVVYGDAEATARVRVAPRIPVNENFDGMKVGEVPPGWIGVDVSTKIVEKNGSKVFMKMAESPSAPYCRMRAFSGPPIPAGYTVEADMMGEERPDSRRLTMSDMGIVNSRYEMMLLASEQALRIVSWAPEPRIQKDVPFEWKPEVWYRARLRVDIEGGQGLIRGKVWPRDEEEPDGWQIEVRDPCPNLEGSPGLYAYTKGATARRHGAPNYFDHYRVIPHD